MQFANVAMRYQTNSELMLLLKPVLDKNLAIKLIKQTEFIRVAGRVSRKWAVGKASHINNQRGEACQKIFCAQGL